jgi:hypothetical protein
MRGFALHHKGAVWPLDIINISALDNFLLRCAFHEQRVHASRDRSMRVAAAGLMVIDPQH